MTIPSFQLRYQTDPESRSVILSDIVLTREPMIVDYSSTYPNNQEAAVSVDELSVTNNAVDVSGYVGNIIITNHTMSDGTFLFYQYQPLYDNFHSGTIKVLDEDGEAVPHDIEYAVVQPSGSQPTVGFPIMDHVNLNTPGLVAPLMYDPLSGHAEIGEPSGSIIFSPFVTPSGGLGYETHADALSEGVLLYDFNTGSTVASGALDFTFILGSDSVYRKTIYDKNEAWNIYMGSGLIGLESPDGSGTINLDNNYWYRGQYIWDNEGVALNVYRESLVDSITQATVLADESKQGFILDILDCWLNRIVTYSGGSVPSVNWSTPSILPRYDQALRWETTPPATTPYRFRILTETNSPMTIIYDAVTPTGNLQNHKEVVNHVPIFQESVIETHEWSRLDDEVTLSGDLVGSATVFVKPLFDGFVSVNVINEQVVVTNGSFRSSPFTESTGKNTYRLLEYDALMPFATDNQNTIYPKALRESHYPAEILTANSVRVLPLVAYHGTWPSHITPRPLDIVKTVTGGVVTSSTVTPENWRMARGVIVYINSIAHTDGDIRDIDETNGIIYLNNHVLKPSDHVEVTFIRKSSYFVCNYPRIKPEVQSNKSWRIYLRPWWPNYFLENPNDRIERLAYRVIENGEPTGSLRSCVTNTVVTETAGTITLADISIYTVINIADARIFGGGLAEGELTLEERMTKFPQSIHFADVAMWGKPGSSTFARLLPGPMIFVRIPTAVKTQIESRFTTSSMALAYIKSVIQKHIATGVFYTIVDENNIPWENPFPIDAQGTEMELA